MNRTYQQIKNWYHWLQARWWRIWYGAPDRKLKIFGVTGTNGKTTTSHILSRMLQEQYGSDKVGMLTTIAFWFGAEERVNSTKMTTLDSREVFAYLRQMIRQGIEYAVIEVTSHALDQNRLAGIKLDGAIILNIAREHLDYHGTMREYVKAKLKIISALKAGAPLVINRELAITNFKFSNNFQKSIFRKVRKITFSADERHQRSTPLAGDWNKENALAAMKLGRAIGLEEGAIERGIAKVVQVPGRMEEVRIQNPSASQRKNIQLPWVVIDYAVTPDALERLYELVRKRTAGKVYAVLGACGNRDRGKRPLMAKAVARWADEVVLTREDPWTEDEEQIFRDLEGGLLKQNQEKTWRRIVDRREAIKYCLSRAKANDAVVVTGKGAETGMAIGKKIIPWNDKRVILEFLKERQTN